MIKKRFLLVTVLAVYTKKLDITVFIAGNNYSAQVDYTTAGLCTLQKNFKIDLCVKDVDNACALLKALVYDKKEILADIMLELSPSIPTMLTAYDKQGNQYSLTALVH